MIIAFIVFHASTKAIIVEAITLGLASAIWVIGAPSMLKRSMQRDFYKNKRKGKLPFSESSMLDFGEDGITEVNGDYSNSVPYSSITSIARSGNRLFVFTDGDKGFVIPLDDHARNGKKVAALLAKKTGLEIEDESAN
jgi:hypothetical protein